MGETGENAAERSDVLGECTGVRNGLVLFFRNGLVFCEVLFTDDEARGEEMYGF